jgi:hypothetical protein
MPNRRVRFETGLLHNYARLLILPLDSFGTFLDAGNEDMAAAEAGGMIQDCYDTHLARYQRHL